MDSVELAKAAASLPLTVLLVLVLVGGYAGWWIYGSLHRAQITDLQAEINRERERADKWEGRYLEANLKLTEMAKTSRPSRAGVVERGEGDGNA